MFSKQFRKAHDRSLSNQFCSFYDDINEYGNPRASRCIYFIPGINGAPGQIRFALPAASRFFGRDLYVKGLYTEAFSASKPVWEKYTIPNLEKKIDRIVEDLTDLSGRFGSVMVFCSSNGFYDFYAAASKLDSATLKKLTLFWVACAPDRFEDTCWEKSFFFLNGFVDPKGYRWVALPNCNLFRGINAEAPYLHKSKAQKPFKYFYKHDIESRFYIGGALWSYFSIACFNDCLSFLTKHTKEKLKIPTYTLVAEHDGYWQGKTVEDMKCIMEKYIERPTILSQPTSHLWIASPEHVYALLEKAFGRPSSSEEKPA